MLAERVELLDDERHDEDHQRDDHDDAKLAIAEG